MIEYNYIFFIIIISAVLHILALITDFHIIKLQIISVNNGLTPKCLSPKWYL